MNRITKTAPTGFGLILSFCILLFLMGCSDSGVSDVSNVDNSPVGEQVETLNSEAELEAYLKKQLASSVNSGYGTRVEVDDAVGGIGDGAAAPGDSDYSNTNIQEEGVDESDMVKTDGLYFYMANDRSFHIVKISDPMDVVATQEVKGYIKALFLYDQKLVVLYTQPQFDGTPWPVGIEPGITARFGFPYWIPLNQRQGVAIYDVSDPENPSNLKTVEFEGHLASSRLTNGKLHIVQQFVPELPPLQHWHDGSPEDRDTTIQTNEALMTDVSLDQMIPYYRVVSDAPEAQTDLPLVSPENFYCPVSKDGGGTVTSIVSFNLDDPALPFDSVGVVADVHIVYASTQSLYLATHQYHMIVPTSEDSASRTEKTIIYKFDLTGDQVQCAGSGAIEGWILNQFSLGEYQGVLRVAATTGQLWGPEPTARNHVYCLKTEEKLLKIVGSIEDLAPGEKIFSARFMGERGYLVTYVNIDPLFTLDLSDPTAPKVVGYLKVPGYSDYIHPYGDDYLITIGKDALLVEEDNFAWYQGVQLSIFDVSDFSDPVLLHKELIGDRGTSSEALHNHKAFTFWAANDLLAIPIALHEHASPPAHPSSWGQRTFGGLYVYRVSTDNGFDLLGRISTDRNDALHYYRPWTRGIFVDQMVYAVTPDAVRSAEIDQIEGTIKTLEIPENRITN